MSSVCFLFLVPNTGIFYSSPKFPSHFALNGWFLSCDSNAAPELVAMVITCHVVQAALTTIRPAPIS